MLALVAWEVIGWALAFFVSVGLGVVTLANYRWAKFFFGFSAAILVTKLALITAPVWPDWAWLTAAYIAIVAALFLAFRRIDLLELRDSTRLLPARLPTPLIERRGGAIPEDALIVFLGSNVSWSNRMPHTILEMGGMPMLTVDRDKRGLVLKVLRIFDATNQIIARIDEDGFWVEPSTRKKRPNRSTLVVYDRTDTEVLRLTLLNRRALSVTGVFRRSGSLTVTVTPETMHVGTNAISGALIGNCGVDYSIG